MPSWLSWVIVCVAGYLIGSFSTGLVVAWLDHKPDLRLVGSKNTGATNALRTMGLRNGLITFLGDVAKAALACGIGWWMIGLHGAMAAGLCTIIGHNWPVFFDFRGGKGVASSCSVMLCCFPELAGISFVLGILVLALTRYVSLASLTVLTSFAVIMAATHWGQWLYIGWALVLLVLCVIRHRANIDRLLHGCENRLSFKKGGKQEKK